MNDFGQDEKVVERRTWISKIGAMSCWGNKISRNLIQVEAAMKGSNLLISSREEPMRILKHMVLIVQGEGFSRKSLKELGWGLLSKMESQNQHEVGPGNP